MKLRRPPWSRAPLLLCAVLVATCPQGSAAFAGRWDESRLGQDGGRPETEAEMAEAVTRAVRVLQASTPLNPARQGRGAWDWPLPGEQVVVRPFDPPAQRWLPGHRGVDLAGLSGDSVRAVAEGRVRFAGRLAGVGVVSVNHHDGVVSTYQPVQAQVRRGEAVVRGQLLGALDGAGSHCARSSCLHLGARRDGDYVDPMVLLRAWEVSLLPRR